MNTHSYTVNLNITDMMKLFLRKIEWHHGRID